MMLFSDAIDNIETKLKEELGYNDIMVAIELCDVKNLSRFLERGDDLTYRNKLQLTALDVCCQNMDEAMHSKSSASVLPIMDKLQNILFTAAAKEILSDDNIDIGKYATLDESIDTLQKAADLVHAGCNSYSFETWVQYAQQRTEEDNIYPTR